MTDHERPPPPARGSVLRTRLRRGLVAQVTWEGPRRDLVVRGMRAEGTVRALSRAVASWQTFDRYDRVSLDLSRLPRLSAELAESLADDARRAHAAGRRLGFIPPLDAAGRSPHPRTSTRSEEVPARDVRQVRRGRSTVADLADQARVSPDRTHTGAADRGGPEATSTHRTG